MYNVTAFIASESIATSEGDAGTAEDRGDRAALDPLRRGRSHPASVHARITGGSAAIAKGVRRSRSRFGARLEPFFHVARGPARGSQRAAHGDGRRHVATHGALREHAATLDAAARACDAVGRLFETTEPHPEVFTLLANELALLSADGAHARPANGLAFRMKLLLAAGIVPHLGACAACGESEHLRGFSAAAGGVVCSSCEAAAFPLDEESYEFLVRALGGTARPGARCVRARAAAGRAGDHRDRRAPRARATAAAARRSLTRAPAWRS